MGVLSLANISEFRIRYRLRGKGGGSVGAGVVCVDYLQHPQWTTPTATGFTWTELQPAGRYLCLPQDDWTIDSKILELDIYLCTLIEKSIYLYQTLCYL